jgi:hypothetical protein
LDLIFSIDQFEFSALVIVGKYKSQFITIEHANNLLYALALDVSIDQEFQIRPSLG